MSEPRTTRKAANGRKRFDAVAFFETAANGRSITRHRKNEVIFSQGDAADAVYYIKKGKIKVTVVSSQGKEAVVAIMGIDEFVGEGCLAGQPKRLSTASAMGECVTMRVAKTEIQRLIRIEPVFSQMFMSHILARNARVEEDLLDQLFNSTEKTARPSAAFAGQLWQGRTAGAAHRKDQSGNARRNDRHDPLAGEPFHEQVSRGGFYRLQWPSRSPQLSVERCAGRAAAHCEVA